MTVSSSAVARRLESVDALRGGVMIVMALDHVRDFIHRAAMSGQSPTDIATTTPMLFMTRWITHFCAPVFMFTAGIGAYFYWKNGRTKAQLSRFLITRGVWLAVLEITVMRLAYNFNLDQNIPFFLLVLWVLGLCMIVLAALAWLPIPLLSVISVATIVLHQLVGWGPVIHQVGAVPFAGHVFIAPYPLIPWFAVMALGFCFGPALQMPADRRNRLLVRIGVATTVAFLLVRALNGYGDPARWVWQPTATYTVLSFLNTTKYAPSLSFLLMTLGPALIVLAAFDRRTFSRTNPLIVFGRVPLFYFVLHFTAAHVASFVLAVFTYGNGAFSFMWQPVPSMGGPAQSFPPNFGWDLWVAYAVWITIVIALYPLCRWFAALKERNRSWWLSYV
ncbi:MAG TPA: heparan-alpha-glucosaminide N-acetyltransferase domain-containing protein [Vicinamibacterales bacterium]|nr:heparan-alpha-glucosaminide N-acetyltransferase domain-containing protein [Vicinamibacterales bacterium]